MKRSLRIVTLWVVGCCLGWNSLAASAAEPWLAGFGKVVITPDELTPLSGYGGRTAPAKGKIHDLHARAAALRDPSGKTVVMVSTDLIGVPATMAHLVCTEIEKRHGIARADIMLTCSHTHCGPALDDELTWMLFLPEVEMAKIKRYQPVLNAKLIDVVGQAIADLKPAQLATGIGKAEFASHRRPPIGTGPIDHEVPVLRVLDQDGKTLRGVLFGYACHNTTMSFEMYCGDYAGFAQLYLEDHHPGAVALFHLGCGGDQNPLPRRKLEICEKYGRMLGVAVEKVMGQEMPAVTGGLKTDLQRIDLPFASVPTVADLEAKKAKGGKHDQALAEKLLAKLAAGETLPAKYPYPIQVWQLGTGVTWVALGGEITVEYSLRIKERLGQGRTWVTGYANDVMSYIPSEKILAEGGY
ncbi:MAG: neutral/alkaline non-lysosomal ceramidase N-terminal domain-containing protein, partial [Planctomycetota bacterium]